MSKHTINLAKFVWTQNINAKPYSKLYTHFLRFWFWYLAWKLVQHTSISLICFAENEEHGTTKYWFGMFPKDNIDT